MKQVLPKPPFTQTLPYYFLINSLKSISTFKTKKALMKPDTFNLKSFPTFPAVTITTPLFSHAFKFEKKTQKIVFVLKKFVKMK